MQYSKYFYIKVSGDYALWAAPESKGGGERISYQVITRQAATGIVDACYFKPVFINVVDEVKVMKPIRTHTLGYRALYNDYSAGLNYISPLEDVEYLIKFHFIWNMDRDDLKSDRNYKKHEAIMDRSIERGGRRDIFLGVREFLGYVEKIDEEEYNRAGGYYKDQDAISFGIMFHSFIYPKKSGEDLISLYTHTVMKKGLIKFKAQEECEVRNILSSYIYRQSDKYKTVDEELEDYGIDEEVSV